jgi:hypothetical protein
MKLQNLDQNWDIQKHPYSSKGREMKNVHCQQVYHPKLNFLNNI